MAPYRQPFRRVVLALCAAALVPTSARAQLTMPRTTLRMQSVQPLAQGAAEPLSALERASMEAVEGLERAVERGMEGASRMGLFGVTRWVARTWDPPRSAGRRTHGQDL